MPKIDEIRFSCYTSLYLFIYLLSVITYLTGNLISIIFWQFTIDDWTLLLAILISGLLIFGGTSLLKSLIRWLQRDLGPGDQCRNEVLIGLIGILICGIAPRVLVYFVEMEEFIIFYSLNVFIITAIIFGLLFVNQFNLDYQITYSLNDKPSWLLILANTVILIALFAYSSLTFELKTWGKTTVILLCHVVFYTMCTSSTVEIWKILSGDLKLREDKEKIQSFGIKGFLENFKFAAKKVDLESVKVQKAETWPDVNINHGNIGIFNKSENGLDEGTITVMTRWTSPSLEPVPASPVHIEDGNGQGSPETPKTSESPETPAERTVQWME